MQSWVIMRRVLDQPDTTQGARQWSEGSWDPSLTGLKSHRSPAQEGTGSVYFFGRQQSYKFSRASDHYSPSGACLPSQLTRTYPNMQNIFQRPKSQICTACIIVR